jgi:hypothetical protein
MTPRFRREMWRGPGLESFGALTTGLLFFDLGPFQPALGEGAKAGLPNPELRRRNSTCARAPEGGGALVSAVISG